MKRMRKVKALLGLLLLAAILMPTISVQAENIWYTYNYDYFGDETESPDAYVPGTVYTGVDFGVGNFASPQGLFVRDDRIFVCDTGNNRIVELKAENEVYTLVRVIDSFDNNGETETFNGPYDVFVTAAGEFYVCDTRSHRILHLDSELKLVKEIGKPEDETLDASFEFLPKKLVVDLAGRIFVQADNVNKGLMEFETDGSFQGYIGASEVKVSLYEYLWKLISTQEQKSRMDQFVPTEYNNLALDSKGFIYVTTAVFDESELNSDMAKPIRKLNAMGGDILVKNGYYPPIGDLYWGRAGGVSGSSRFVDIVVDENDTYYAIDRVRGRVFAYDFQGNMLYAFGGLGNKSGYFTNPSAIEMVGDTLLVMDYLYGTITQLKLTDYGAKINEGLALYKKGLYEESAVAWQEVLKYNGNYDLAYIGIGRALLRQEEYGQAMEYFKLKRDTANYSKAFKLYRKEWIEENIWWFFIILVVLLVVPFAVKTVKKIRREALEE